MSTLPERLRIGTRGSALAVAQSTQVGERIAAATGIEFELVRIRTVGDVDTSPLASIGGTGVFVTAVREALLAGRVDIAVHSFKDLPTAPAPGVLLAAVPHRVDPADVLCATGYPGLHALPLGARVGTGSPRRAAQLRRLRDDLVPVAIRGNIDTRLAAVGETVDAIVLAHAGLERLGRLDAVTEVFSVDDMLPAPAQGAIAVECRADSPHIAAVAGAVDHPPSRQEAAAERAVLAGLEAGCSAPVGALARVTERRLTLRVRVISPDGHEVREHSRSGDAGDAERLGRDAAQVLLADGAGSLMGRRS